MTSRKVIIVSDIKELNKKIDSLFKSFGIKKEVATSNEELKLRLKLQKLQRQKLVDGLKPGCRTDKIKSAGNGL